MDSVPSTNDLAVVLATLTAFAIVLTILGVPAADTRQMIGDLCGIIPLYVLNKAGKGPRLRP